MCKTVLLSGNSGDIALMFKVANCDLKRFAKKKSGVKVTIYTCSKTKITPLDIQKFNEQYPVLELKHTEKIHDRFLIVDNIILYHIGASLKDLGKKCFAFEILDSSWIAEIMWNL
jgi:hypothetical protein